MNLTYEEPLWLSCRYFELSLQQNTGGPKAGGVGGGLRPLDGVATVQLLLKLSSEIEVFDLLELRFDSVLGFVKQTELIELLESCLDLVGVS